MAKKVTLIGLETMPDVKEGDDLTTLLLEAIRREGVEIEDGDILVVTQKLVSKAEGRIVDLRSIEPSERASSLSNVVKKDPRLVEAILREAEEVLKACEGHLIVRMKIGLVCANAGVDRSNVAGSEEVVSLLPLNPDGSARRIREGIKRLSGKRVGVIISDTFGRPLREGQVDVAIGLSSVKPFKDYRGRKDTKGYVLRVKNIAVADELASAAELLIGQADERIPVVIVKGLSELIDEGCETAKPLNMDESKWLFK